MKDFIPVGTQNFIDHIYIQSNGFGLVGLNAATSGLVCFYKTTISPSPVQVPLTSGVLASYQSGQFQECDKNKLPGLYEFHIPNEAISGPIGTRVAFLFEGAKNLYPLPLQYEISPNLNAIKDCICFIANNMPQSTGLYLAPDQTFSTTGNVGGVDTPIQVGLTASWGDS